LRHDLRNPIGTIRSALSLMADEAVPEEARRSPRFRAMIERNTVSLDQMIVARLSDAEARLLSSSAPGVAVPSSASPLGESRDDLARPRQSDDRQRSYAGNRPSATILLDRLNARMLGALIAFYEHRTFANAVLLGINPFDQFGVELGKQIARQLGEGADASEVDASTRALMERAGV